MQHQLLYKDLARYYDLLYSFKDYKKEAQAIKTLIQKYKKSSGRDLLDVACGTGYHALYLSRNFKVTGIDLNNQMLKLAQKRVPSATFRLGNMANFKLNTKFDAITCLFSSIGYIKEPRKLQATINNFAMHLKPGGVVLLEPWLRRSTYKPLASDLTTYLSDKIKIARVSVSRIRGNDSVLEMNYLIAENGEIKYFRDRHELAMFEPKVFLKYMKKAGLSAKFIRHAKPTRRGLFVGVRSLHSL
jgi:ubiquinone/menaquinone biosynthesis C-methylase UbiE